MSIRVCLVLLACFVSFIAVGRDYPVQHFTVDNGLPSNNVYSVYRDPEGFLWFSTDKGLCKYNGISFENFTTKDGLPDNDVFFVKEDLEGRLWVGCYNGALCFIKNGHFHTAVNTPWLTLTEKHSFPEHMIIGSDSSLSILYHYSPYAINVYHNKKSVLSIKTAGIPELNMNHPPCYVSRGKGNLYSVIWRDKTLITDSAGNVLRTALHRGGSVYDYSESQDQGRLFSSAGIFSLSEDTLFRFTGRLLPGLFIYKISRHDSDWFIGTADGLFVNNNVHLLQGNKITDIARDDDGNYWVSSKSNGVFRLPRNFLKMACYKGAYTGEIVYASAIGRQLFFTTNSGQLFRISDSMPVLVFDQCRQFGDRYGTRRTGPVHNPDPVSQGKFISNDLRYYGFEPKYSFTLENVGGRPFHPRAYTAPVWVGAIKEVIPCNDSMYVRSTFNTYTFNRNDLNAKNISYVDFDSTTFRRSYAAALDARHKLLLSVDDGVCEIKNHLLQKTAIPGNTALLAVLATGSNMAGITLKNDLVLWTHLDSQPQVSYISEPRALPERLFLINDSTVFVCSNYEYQLLHIGTPGTENPHRLKIVENSSLPLGAQYICCNDSLCCFFKEGTITILPLSELYGNHPEPRLAFKSLRTRDRTCEVSPGLTISYAEARDLNISFTPFSFGGSALLYEYSVAHDSTSHWQPLSNPQINLFEPGYGVFIVKVRARTLSGNFSIPYVFSFSVSRPFWATWWFLLLVACCLSGFIFILVYSYRAKVARERGYLQKELTSLRMQMNPHFLFNTLNNIYSLAKINSPGTATMVHRLSEMLRYLTYKSTQALTTVEEEISVIKANIELQKIRFDERLMIRVLFDIDEPNTAIAPLLLLQLVENAFKHGVGERGDGSFIDINLTLRQGNLSMQVTNSIARETVEAEEYKGVGLANTKRQLALLYRTYSLDASAGINNIFAAKLTIDLNSYRGDQLSDSRG